MQSIIVFLYKVRGVTLGCENYWHLKLVDQVIKVLDMVAENFRWQQVTIDGMRFVLMPGRSTTDAIFIVHQLQAITHAVNKTLNPAFVDLKKAFHHVPRCIVWCGSYRACMEMQEAESVLVATWVKSSLWKWVFTKDFAWDPTVNRGSGSPLQRFSNRMSLGKPVCRWPGHHLWITGGIAREADPQED